VRYAENTFDAADRLVSAQVRYGSHTNAAVAETYLYDGNGALTNLVSGSNAVFSAAYDPLGQLSSLRLSASARNLSYDALGNRLISGDRLWIPDHADPLKRPLIEADAATGAPLRYYLWAPGRLLGFIDAASGALTVAHCDEYGSVVALTDASGNTLHTACYGPTARIGAPPEPTPRPSPGSAGTVCSTSPPPTTSARSTSPATASTPPASSASSPPTPSAWRAASTSTPTPKATRSVTSIRWDWALRAFGARPQVVSLKG
jgi:hypothetical protein